MRVAIGVLAAMAVLGAASPAAADWGFTKWGMTQAQVVEASGGKAQLLSPDEARAATTFKGTACQVQIAQPQTIADLDVQKINFCFGEDGRLRSIEMILDESSFDLADQRLASVYGEAVYRGDRRRVFNDPKGGDTVQLLLLTRTMIVYRPVPSGL